VWITCEHPAMEPAPPSVSVREERPADHPAVRRVVAAAFGSDAEADLVDRIRSSPEHIPELDLVAVLDDAVVGHVMISGAVIRNDEGDRRITMLSPLAVDPDHQERGIGTALVRAALEGADQRGEPIVVLEGDPRYYGRFGFEHSERHGIRIHLPSWAPPEAAQVALLTAYRADDQGLRGTVVYPPAFDGLA
jgi:putative acetyltransferase